MDSEFLRHFLRNPLNVGALVPLSARVTEGITKFLRKRNLSQPCKILEVGAGTGSVTEGIIATLQENDRLDLVEIDTECCKILKSKFGHDPRIIIHCLSILDWKPDYHYDFIISTLPLNSFPPSTVTKIFTLYESLSSEEGVCTYVEYIALAKLALFFSIGENKQANKLRRQILENIQNRYLIEKESVLTNFLPCHVYHLKLKKPQVQTT